jgi:hypothetical protein
MVIENATHGQQPAFAPDTVVKNRGRLWRVDGQDTGRVTRELPSTS